MEKRQILSLRKKAVEIPAPVVPVLVPRISMTLEQVYRTEVFPDLPVAHCRWRRDRYRAQLAAHDGSLTPEALELLQWRCMWWQCCLRAANKRLRLARVAVRNARNRRKSLARRTREAVAAGIASMIPGRMSDDPELQRAPGETSDELCPDRFEPEW